MNYSELLRLAAPETVVVITALAVLAADFFALRGLDPRLRLTIGCLVGGFGLVAAIAWTVVLPEQGNVARGMFVVNPLTQLLKAGILTLTLLTLLLSVGAEVLDHVGEFVALILLGTVGMLFLMSAEDVLMVFLALEMTSLSLYVLTGFSKGSVQSAEAAFKYFLFGGVAAAFTLFGLSLIYGVAGATGLSRIAVSIQAPELDPLLLAGMAMTLAGFGFKVAVVPFHLWAPDVYQGAPVPSAALIASGSKVAGFAVLAKLMLLGFSSAAGSAAWLAFRPGWVPLLGVIAGLSMIVGNLAAIVQTSVRRLLAYSAIAHAGYMLLGLLPPGGGGVPALLYYALTYGLTALGAFGVVSILQQQGGGDRIADFSGLWRRAPLLSFCMLVFMLSLAGIPPLSGFFGKFFVFSAALSPPRPELGLLWLVILAIAASAVSLYYYLSVLKQIFVAEPLEGSAAVNVPWPSLVAVLSATAGVVALGVFPGWLVDALVSAAQVAGFGGPN